MATYRDIGNSEVEVGAPITQPLMQALKDNQTAITEGEGNAPRVKPAALVQSTSNAQTKDTAVFRARVKRSGYNSGNQDDADVLSTEYFVGRGGSYAVHLYSIGGATSSVQIKLYKNNSVIQTTAAGTGGVSTWYQLTFAAGDKIKIAFVDGDTSTDFASGNAYIWIYTSNPIGDAQHDLGIQRAKTPSTDLYSIQSLPDTY